MVAIHFNNLFQIRQLQLLWDNFVINVVGPEEWVENFRMSKNSFMSLCNKLKPYKEKDMTTMRMPIPLIKRVAITIYYLVDEGRYRTTANAFGLSRSAVSVIVREVCQAISLHMGSKWIKMPPTDNRRRGIRSGKRNLKKKYGFLQ